MLSACMLKGLIAGAVTGVAGGLAVMTLGLANVFTGPVLGAGFGVGFALLVSGRATTPGAGLIWGLAYALVLWLAVPLGVLAWRNGMPMAGMLDAAREHFPLMIAYLLAFGLPLGVVQGWIGLRHRAPVAAGTEEFSTARALLVGSLAGLVGGWVFGHLQPHAELNPLVGSAMIGSALNLLIGAVIGASFGLLFQRDVRGYGSCMGWGLAYGMLWWFLGPLTLQPLFAGQPLAWNHATASVHFGGLVGHICFGLLLGLTYATIDRAWVAFFHESDPLNRAAEGPGTRTLQSLGWGAVAGLAGGVVYSLPLAATGILPQLAHLVGGQASWLGLIVGLVISVLIGMSYGLLFLREAPHLGTGVGWGLVYGLVWWFVGQLTLLPWMLNGHVAWSIADAAAGLPALVGHLFYGATTAAVFMLLELRYTSRSASPATQTQMAMQMQLAADSPAPALWFFAVGLGVLLPILLG